MEEEPNVVEIKENPIYVIKTTGGQERAVANLLEQIVKKEEVDIYAILSPNELRGYILIEAASFEIVEEVIQNVPHARTVIKGETSLKEVGHFLTPKPMVTGISEGSIVELISGPFKGEKAVVKRVDKAHEEITMELIEAMVPIPITVKGDNVRVLDSRDD